MSADSTHVRVSSDFGAIVGPIWFAGWLFMLGYTGPTFWKVVLGLILWPYFLGQALR